MKNNDIVKLNEVLRDVRLSENREAADGMERMGLKYEKNFGVSLLKLKQIAEKYKPNNKLAEELRQKRFRETLILSFMIADKDKLKGKDLNEIFGLINTAELAEQLVLNILEKDGRFYSYIDLLFKEKNEFLISAAFILLSRIALIDKNIDNVFFEDYFDTAVKFSDNESLSIRKATARFLRQSALRNDYLKNKIISLCDKIKQKNNILSDFVFEEVMPFLD